MVWMMTPEQKVEIEAMFLKIHLHALEVECPACGAIPDVSCMVGKDGKGDVHHARVGAAYRRRNG